jgi:hypothetical protein
MQNLRFCIQWELYEFDKKRVGTRSAFWCVGGAQGRCTIFHAQVGAVRIPQNELRDMLRQTCVFPFGGISGSRSAFWCIRGTKYQRTIFYARVGPMHFP